MCKPNVFHWSNGLVVMISVLHRKAHRRSPVRSWIGPLFDLVLETLDPVPVSFPSFFLALPCNLDVSGPVGQTTANKRGTER